MRQSCPSPLNHPSQEDCPSHCTLYNEDDHCTKSVTVCSNSFFPAAFKPVYGNAYLPAGCYVFRSIVSNDEALILITNVTDKAVDIMKAVRVGSIESLDDASDTRYWEKPTNDIRVYFGTREHSEQSAEVVNKSNVEA